MNPIHEEIVESLSTMQLDDYSPFEALQALYQMQKKLKGVTRAMKTMLYRFWSFVLIVPFPFPVLSCSNANRFGSRPWGEEPGAQKGC